MNRKANNRTATYKWRGLYTMGGYSALMISVLLLGEIAAYAVLPRTSNALGNFELFRINWFAGLLTFDLLGIIAYLLFIPTILAIYVTVRQESEAIMAVATVLFFIGISEFFATNTGLSMLSLSGRYAAASTETEKAALLAAGEAMLTLFNENAFLLSYVFVSFAWAMISVVMLRSKVFGRINSIAGILAGLSGILAVFLEHVLQAKAIFIAVTFYFAAIVFLVVWIILAGQRLLLLRKNIPFR